MAPKKKVSEEKKAEPSKEKDVLKAPAPETKVDESYPESKQRHLRT